MAAQFISDQIKTRGAKGVVDASDVAYSYKTENGIELIDKSIKDIIQEGLDLNNIDSSKVKYKFTNLSGLEQEVSLNEILELLSTEELNTAVESVTTSAGKALTALGTFMTEKETLNASISDITEKINNTNNKLDSLDTNAKKLASVFNADALFLIMSEEEYNQLTDKNEATIYFCYDNN